MCNVSCVNHDHPRYADIKQDQYRSTKINIDQSRASLLPCSRGNLVRNHSNLNWLSKTFFKRFSTIEMDSLTPYFTELFFKPSTLPPTRNHEASIKSIGLHEPSYTQLRFLNHSSTQLVWPSHFQMDLMNPNLTQLDFISTRQQKLWLLHVEAARSRLKESTH